MAKTQVFQVTSNNQHLDAKDDFLFPSLNENQGEKQQINIPYNKKKKIEKKE